MEHQYQKVVNISYLALGALIAFLSLSAMMRISNTYDLESHVKSIEYIVRGLSVAIGAGVFFGLYSNATTNNFMNEVAVELLSKVTWPEKRETGLATVVVIAAVILSGLLLALFDWISSLSLHGLFSMLQRWFS